MLYIGATDDKGKISLFISSVHPDDSRFEQNMVEYPASKLAQTDPVALSVEKTRLRNVLTHGGATVIIE
jgi:hypothetical protein